MAIGKLLTFIIGAIIIISAFVYIFNQQVALEPVTFVANNTYYSLASPNVDTSNFHLYYFQNTTYEIPTARYALTTTQVKLYANGTLAFPNVTVGSTYYASYLYTPPAMTVWGSDWTWIFGIIMLIVAGIVAIVVFKIANIR